MFRAAKLGQFERAEELYTSVLAAQERTHAKEAVLTRYNLACMRVAQGRHEDALALLQSALDRGYQDDDILSDPDLDPLRTDARFAAMTDEVQRRRQAPP